MTGYETLLAPYKSRFYSAMTARLLDEENESAYTALDELLVEIISMVEHDENSVADMVVWMTETGLFGGTGEPTSIDEAWQYLQDVMSDIVEGE